MPRLVKELRKVSVREYEMLENYGVGPKAKRKRESKKINETCGRLQHW